MQLTVSGRPLCLRGSANRQIRRSAGRLKAARLDVQTHPAPLLELPLPKQPVIGYIQAFNKDPLSFMIMFHQACKDQGLEAAAWQFGFIKIVYVASPRNVQHILQDTQNIYHKTDVTRRGVSLVTGNGLLLVDGDVHRRRRRLIMPVFTLENVGSFVDIMSDVAEASVGRIKQAMAEPAYNGHGLHNGQPPGTIALHQESSKTALAIISRAVFSTDLSDQSTSMGEALEYMMKFSTKYLRSVLPMPLWVPSKENTQYHQAKRVMDDVVNSVVSGRRAERLHRDTKMNSQQHNPQNSTSKCPFASSGIPTATDTTAGEPSAMHVAPTPAPCPAHLPSSAPGAHAARKVDLLDLLLDAKNEDGSPGLTDSELRDEVLTFTMAGHDTTGNALVWIMLTLAERPDILDRARQEALQVCGPPGSPVKLEHLSKLTYLEAVIWESLRLNPPAWGFDRQPIQDDTLPDGTRVNKGDVILAAPLFMQQDDRYFPDPHAFKPERFLNEPGTPQVSSAPKFTFFPFGGGARSCIGNMFAMYEMKVILATWLRAFPRVHLHPGCKVKKALSITARPDGPVYMTFEVA